MPRLFFSSEVTKVILKTKLFGMITIFQFRNFSFGSKRLLINHMDNCVLKLKEDYRNLQAEIESQVAEKIRKKQKIIRNERLGIESDEEW